MIHAGSETAARVPISQDRENRRVKESYGIHRWKSKNAKNRNLGMFCCFSDSGGVAVGNKEAPPTCSILLLL